MVDVNEAQIQSSTLLERVEAGEEVVIKREGEPIAKLVRYRRAVNRRFGSLKGVIELDDSFFDPLPEEELRLWEGGN